MIITRYHNRVIIMVTVEFLTPTFLGGADQEAELRAAPFKNLLRQWWRLVQGRHGFTELLRKENALFGAVLDEKEAHASKVRLAINATNGEFTIINDELNLGTTRHPEVNNGMAISNALYLGFGPITSSKRNTKRYITPGSKAYLTLTIPRDNQEEFHRTLGLIDAFGCIGSRSRNGWGAIALSGEEISRAPLSAFQTESFMRLLKEGKEYPSALGEDGRFLCWETQPEEDWAVVMGFLGEAYMQLRTSINIKGNGLQKRHALGYPVTHHPVDAWERNGRMPSQLRLMVKRNQENKLVGRILHLPHKLPKRWDERKLGPEIHVWQEVHKLLDGNRKLHRAGGKR